jgi:ribonuclease BN (tRNA processing enzyme)
MHNLIQFLGAVGAIFSVLAVSPYVAVGQKLPARAATPTQIVLLGTGTPRADPERSGPATAIVVNGTPYLVDAGPGIVRRAAAAYNKGITGLAIPNLQTAFITHLHYDHTVGFPDLIFTTWGQGRHRALKVYGPTGLEAMTKYIILAWQVDIGARTNGLEQRVPADPAVEAHDVKPGIIYQDSGVKVIAFPVSHGELEAYGYAFQSSDRTVVISGDTSPSPALIDSCHKCDVLVHEAYSEDYRPADMTNWLQYRAKYHTTTTQVAEIANKTQPGLLVIYHRGVGAPGREISDEQYLAEIRRAYVGRVVIGHDLDVY